MICVFTVVHPKSKKFFESFITSVNRQSHKNFFLFLCVNECRLSIKQLKKIKCKYFLLNVNESSGQARKKAFNKLKDFNIVAIVFIDSDDLLHKDRIKFDVKKINNIDFVVTNFYAMNEKGVVYNKEKFFKGIKNNSIIKYNQIRTKNFIGFSNLTIKSSVFFSILNQINYKLIALDWLIAKILLLNNYRGKFFNRSLTYYRQYSENVSPINNVSKKNLLKIIKIKKQHFIFFKRFLKLNYEKEINKLKAFKYRVGKLKKKNLKGNFWWDI